MHKEIIGIIGAGTMGGGIAQMFAEHGFQVLIWDINEAFAAKGVAKIEQRLNKSVDKGKLAVGEAKDIFSRIKQVNDLSGFATANLLIEAISEDYNAKTELYKKLENIIPADTIIGTNTSSLSVTDLANSLQVPERFLGTHFFNPPTKLELVELITTPSLSPKAKEKVNDILERCEKVTVNVTDSPGFIVNRLLLPFINEAAKLLDAGVAEAEDIDTAMRLGTLHPAGPLQVADLIGLDICLNILEQLAESLGQPNYKPAKTLVNLVNAGKLGRKTGEGFHVY